MNYRVQTSEWVLDEPGAIFRMAEGPDIVVVLHPNQLLVMRTQGWTDLGIILEVERLNEVHERDRRFLKRIRIAPG